MTTPPKSARAERRIGGERRVRDSGWQYRAKDKAAVTFRKRPNIDRRAPDSPAQGEGGTARIDPGDKFKLTHPRTAAVHQTFHGMTRYNAMLALATGMESALTAATKEIERLREDAERYQWLRDNIKTKRWQHTHEIFDTFNSLPEVIDYARAALTSTAPKDKE